MFVLLKALVLVGRRPPRVNFVRNNRFDVGGGQTKACYFSGAEAQDPARDHAIDSVGAGSHIRGFGIVDGRQGCSQELVAVESRAFIAFAKPRRRCARHASTSGRSVTASTVNVQVPIQRAEFRGTGSPRHFGPYAGDVVKGDRHRTHHQLGADGVRPRSCPSAVRITDRPRCSRTRWLRSLMWRRSRTSRAENPWTSRNMTTRNCFPGRPASCRLGTQASPKRRPLPASHAVASAGGTTRHLALGAP